MLNITKFLSEIKNMILWVWGQRRFESNAGKLQAHLQPGFKPHFNKILRSVFDVSKDDNSKY